MSAWTLSLMLGVSAIWIAMLGAVAYLAVQLAVRRSRLGRPPLGEVRARGLEPPRAVRPSGT